MYEEQTLVSPESPPQGDFRPAVAVPDTVLSARALAEDLEADMFALMFCATQGETRRLAPVFDSSFPGVSLLSRSLSARSADGFARQAADAHAPLWWRPADEPPILTASARCWATEVESPFPGTSGIAFPVSVERGRSGVIAFAGDNIMLDETWLCDAHARACAIFTDVARQRMQDRARLPAVSKREIECLRLTAQGLTSDDIAAELGLSVHTANQYLSNSTHKLNAVNRIHAVAKALRCGLID